MKLAIIDDHPLARRGLAAMLNEDKNIEDIKEASNVQEGISIISKEKPDIAILDLRLGKEDGLEVPLKVKSYCINTKFIIVTSTISQEEFLKAEQIGVCGYVLKDAFPEDIIYAINAVSRGKKYYDPEIIEHNDKKDSNGIMIKLTDREKDVLRELGKGLSNEEIAKKLYISENTVKKHVSNILSKLELKHRTQAVLLINTAVSF